MRINARIVAQALLLAATSAAVVARRCQRTCIHGRPTAISGPVALSLLDDGKLLLTANRRSGRFRVIDTKSGRVTDEISIGKKLSGLVAVPGRDLLLATDEEAHEVILIQARTAKTDCAARLPVAAYPIGISLNREGTSAGFVASLWSRQLSICDVVTAASDQQAAGLMLSKVLCLPFAPRKQLLVEADESIDRRRRLWRKTGDDRYSAGRNRSVCELPRIISAV